MPANARYSTLSHGKRQDKHNSFQETDTYGKIYLPFMSHHPSSMKRSIVKSLMNRVNYISPELTEERECELQHVIDVMVENGYPEACVERWKMNPPANSISRIKEEGKTSLCIPYV